MDATSRVLHEERQSSPAWVWILIGVLWVAVISTTWGIWRQWSEMEPSRRSLALWLGPGIGLTVMVVVHTVLGGTRIAVTDEEITFHLGHWPLPVRIPLVEILACRPVTYRPILEFGGWGIRRGKGGTWAYTAQGNRGLLLYLEGDRRALLGSDDPEALSAAVSQVGVIALEPGTDIAAPLE